MKYIINIALVALLAASCNKELAPVQVEESGVPMSFTINRETPGNSDPELKASLSGLSVVWSDADKISVLDGSVVPSATQETVFHNNAFTVVSGGSKSATFDGTCEDVDTYYAISPYFTTQSIQNAVKGAAYYYYFNTLNTDVLTTILPYRQVATKGSFDPDALIMMGKSETGNKQTINMKQFCGLVKFTLTQSDVTSIEFRGNNGEWLSGVVLAKFDGDGNPVLDASNTTSTNGGFIKDLTVKHVVMQPASGLSAIEAGTYYLALPPTSFTNGITMTFTKEDGTIAEKSGSAALNVTRAGIVDLGTIDTSSLTWYKAISLPFSDYPRQGTICLPFTTATTKEKMPTAGGYYSITSWPSSTSMTTAQLAVWVSQVKPISTASNTGWLGSTYTFNLYATKYVSPHTINGLRLGAAANGDDYIEFPGISGKSLRKVSVVWGNACTSTIVDGTGAAMTGVDSQTHVEGDESSFTFAGTEGAAYRLKDTKNSMAVRRIILYFE